MHALKNLKIGTRLGLGFGALLLIIVGIAATGFVGAAHLFDEVRTLYEDRTVPLGQLGEINHLAEHNRVLVMDMMLNPAPANVQARDAELRTNVARIGQLWQQFTAHALTPQEQQLADTFTSARQAYVQQGLLPASEALLRGDTARAAAIYREQISVFAPQVQHSAGRLVQLQIDVAAQEFATAGATERMVDMVMLAATALALVLGLGLAWSLTRSITGPIGRAVQLAQTVAAGHLGTRIEIDRHDETGQLLAALKAMDESLVAIVGNVRHGSDSIATGSAQIATGNADLSQRTEEQASNLQQTAASMEELTSTVRQNTDTARQASQLAGSASQAAAEGGAVVERVVATMERISAASRRIADIIGTIDGIAFQTNILALNAAVEAARAGEQGRGFAVVASEVRSLARRSAEAAKEIKSLVGENLETVEAGTQLVDAAGRSMADIVAQTRRVDGLIAEISAASLEQSQGIDQVGDAVSQLDQVTQQNAALVEESAAAAESLRQQAARLAQVVSVFRLNGEAVAAA
jgi:methyl-accepting chemotaxis protein-1 (serine sensor receptor)